MLRTFKEDSIFLIFQTQTDHVYSSKGKKSLVQPSKKHNCPSTIKLQEVLCFEGHEVQYNFNILLAFNEAEHTASCWNVLVFRVTFFHL